MAREPLRALDEDVDRTIAAGVGGVAGDEGLREVQAALGALGQKVPALAKVSEQVGRVLASAGGRDVAAELLGLTASSRQLRAARAQGPAGAQPAATLAPVEQGSGPLATPLPHAAVVALQQALLAQGPQPVQKLSAAAKSGAVTDLRLLSPAVRALGHKSAALAECVGESVLPLFGAGAAHAIARTFNPKGGAVDVRRLRAYTACAGAGARELLERSFAGGSPEVRACALERIGAVDAKRAEDLALPLLQAKKTAALLQCAAIRALGHSRSEEAFTRISYALDAKAANVRNAAGDALGTSPHPKALDVLLAKLVDKELRFAKYSSPRMKKGMTPAQRQLAYKEARKRNNETAQRAQGKALLVTVLGKRKEKKAGARLRELWKKSNPRWEINRAVFGALYDSKDDGLRKLAFEVAGDAKRSGLSWMLVHRVFDDETVDAYDVLGSRIEAANKKATSMAQRVSGMIRTRKEFSSDDRWKKWVAGWATGGTWAADGALQTMIAWRMPEANELVRKKLMAAKPNWQANRLIDAAQRLRLSDVSERIAKLTKLKSGRNVLYSAARYFGSVRDLAVLPMLEEALVAHKKWGKNHYGYKALEKVVVKWRPAAAKLAAKAAKVAAKAAKKAGVKKVGVKKAPVAKKAPAKKAAVKKPAVKKAAAKKKPAVKKAAVKKVAVKKAVAKKPVAKKPAAKKAAAKKAAVKKAAVKKAAAKKKPAAKRAP